MTNHHITRGWRIGVATLALIAVSGCGGGGSGGITSTPDPDPAPAPSPSPTPVPTPTPTPTPTSTDFNTAEYRRSDGPEFHGAITAWQKGTTGSGSIIAVVDSGIDRDSPEFAGRIHPSSRDVAGSRGIEAEDDHGTNVAMVAAAARDGKGILGIAFDAQVLALRADSPGSCATDTPEDPSLGCSFFDTDIAAGVDVAVAAGASVINLSLGGDTPTGSLLDAVRKASAAGVVVVVAAGNYGDGSDPDFDPNQPTPFATALRNAGGDNVIIVGSVDEGGTISGFSNRAGNDASFYLTARGERICCVYENGEIYVESDATGSYTYVFSGTSFAAPQVAGAVALIKQAFPNMTAGEIVQLLLETATDAGATGTDTTYGRGILDIAKAFQPAGAMKVAGTRNPIALGSATALGSAAMGDALDRTGSVATVATDKYDRAYGIELSSGFRSHSVREERLASSLAPGGRRVTAGNSDLAMAFTVRDPHVARPDFGPTGQLQLTRDEARQAEVLAGRVIAKIGPKLSLAMAVREGEDSLSSRVRGAERPAFLLAREADGGLTTSAANARALAVGWKLGEGTASISAESGDVVFGTSQPLGRNYGPEFDRHPYRGIAIDYDRRMGPLAASIGVKWLAEEATLLGGWFGGVLGGKGANSLFLRGSSDYAFAPGWHVGAGFVLGRSWADAAGLVGQGSTIDSSSWTLDLSREQVFGRSDRMGFRLAQPLRVEAGGLALAMPVGYDYATESPVFGQQRVGLSPSGRELVGELRWSGPLGPGWGGASIYYRRDPGHVATAPEDAGVALNWSMTF